MREREREVGAGRSPTDECKLKSHAKVTHATVPAQTSVSFESHNSKQRAVPAREQTRNEASKQRNEAVNTRAPQQHRYTAVVAIGDKRMQDIEQESKRVAPSKSE